MALVIRTAVLGNFGVIVSVGPVNIFRRREDEDRVRLHFLQQVYRAFNVRAERDFSVGGILAGVRGEMNYDFIRAGSGCIQRTEHVQVRAPRKILSVKETADVCAEITTAAGD